MATNSGTGATINLSDSWGSALAGAFVSLVFYGISILQMFLYYECHSKDDRILLKSLVAVVFVLNTLHTFLITAGVWQYFVVHFGDVKFLGYTHAPLLITVVVTSVVSSTVQSYFIYRIWSLIQSRFKWLFPAILMPFIVAQPVLAVLYMVRGLVFQTSVFGLSGSLFTTATIVFSGIATAIDITITVSLCTLLAMGQTGFERTDRMLVWLIFISVNTGLSSALFAFFVAILLAIYPTDLIFTAMYYPLCTVYCNTLLANLNVRAFVRDRGDSNVDQLGTLATLQWLKQEQVVSVGDVDTFSGQATTEV